MQSGRPPPHTAQQANGQLQQVSPTDSGVISQVESKPKRVSARASSTAVERMISGSVQRLSIMAPDCLQHGYIRRECEACKQVKSTIQPRTTPFMLASEWDIGERDKHKFGAVKLAASGFDCEDDPWQQEQDQEQPHSLEEDAAADRAAEQQVEAKAAGKSKLPKVFRYRYALLRGQPHRRARMHQQTKQASNRR